MEVSWRIYQYERHFVGFGGIYFLACIIHDTTCMAWRWGLFRIRIWRRR